MIRNLLVVCFVMYMILLVYFLFFSEKYGRTTPYETYQYNLHPFREILRYIRYRRIVGMDYFLVNVIGNVMAFMPYGFLLPVLWREQRKGYKNNCKYFLSFIGVTFSGLLVSFLVESIQLITKVGCFDVDDLMMNTFGVMAGYFCYFIIKKMIGFVEGKGGSER